MSSSYYGDGPRFAFPALTSAVRLLIWINLAMFLVGFVIGPRASDVFGLSWDGLDDLYGLGLLRFVTSIFTHSFSDPSHILFNMISLYFFGTLVERSSTGKAGMFRLYLLAGLAGGVTQLLLSLLTGEDPSIIGASGAAMGILIYAAVLAPRTRVIFIIFPIELRWLVTIVVLLDVYPLLLSFRVGGAGDAVAHGAHLGGALYGFLAVRFWRVFHTTPQDYLAPGRDGFFSVFRGLSDSVEKMRQQAQVRAAQRAHRDEADRQQELDAILDKVKRQGLDGLTPAERRRLQKLSDSMRR